MKLEIKPRDWKLLVIAFSALIVVLMFRLAILPAVDAYETGKIAYEEKSAQAEEMQRLLDAQSANQTRISEGTARLEELSGFCYEVMENRQVDALVTGAALAHNLFPSHLSISEQTTGTLAPYLYSESGAAAISGTGNGEAQAMPDGTTDNASGDVESQAAVSGEMADGAVRKVEASISMNGSESDMKAFLNDIEENYPAIHVKSFVMSENLYMNTEQQPVTETQMSVVLEIYMYNRPEN